MFRAAPWLLLAAVLACTELAALDCPILSP